MKFGKRQLVLAALVVALGTAVYLNWAFSGNNQLLATNAAASTSSEKELGAAQLVNGSAPSGSSASSGSGASSSASSNSTDYFSQARLSRQKARDEAVELLEKVLADANSNDTAKKDAVAKAADIAQNVLKESNIENLIKAKGFEDCVVFIQNGECSVVVKVKESSANNATIIKDIVSGQSGVANDKIKIVENK